MKLKVVLLIVLSAALAQAGSYSQDFDSASNGSTDLGDGTTITDSGSGVAQVYDYGTWKALRLTQDAIDSQNTIANFALSDLDSGSAIVSFTATFDVLLKSTEDAADGFSFNFGTLGLLPDGGEEGMSGASMLSIGWDTYDNGSDPNSIEIFVNGSSVANNTSVIPIISGDLNGAFRSVTITWDSNGLNVSYDGIAVFTDLDVSGFSASSGDRFAFAARSGTEYEDVFIDNVNISTVVPEPASALLLLAGGGLIALKRRFFSKV